MDCQKYQELEERLKLRNKLLNLGICLTAVGPTGPQGDIGPEGPTTPSTSSETTKTGKMTLQDPWIIPNLSSYFNLLEANDIRFNRVYMKLHFLV